MDLLKALKRTTIISAAAATALFSFSATEARADAVAAQGHMSASVQGTLSITETAAMNFGNFSVTCGGGTCAGDGTVTLSESGTRTLAGGTPNDAITLLNGASSTPAGKASGTNLETGGQQPGFFAIAGAVSASTVYVSFADKNGAIIDPAYGPATHPGNYVTLSNAAALAAFTVDSFTFETDSGTNGGSEGGGGYTRQAAHATDIYGSNVTLTGTSATLRVGAKLHTVSAVTPVPGQYTGTYYVMVSY